MMTSDERLDAYRLKMPDCDRFRRWPVETTLRSLIPRHGADPLTLPTPFFWYDPPWHFVSPEQATGFARAIVGQGVTVSALHRELSNDDTNDASSFFARMAPHRCDRAGWLYRDFASAAIIDLRLSPGRDENGHFAYHPLQMKRWQNLSEYDPAPPDLNTDAMLFSPEWRSLDDMRSKVAQLRKLSGAAVFVSFEEVHLPTLLPAAIQAAADGVILIAEADPADAIVRCRQLLQSNAASEKLQLWVFTPKTLAPEDAIKCFALGANGLAVDELCNRYLFQGHHTGNPLASWIAGVRGHARSCNAADVQALSRDDLVKL